MIPVPESVQALIFDCDGTLVDSMPVHLEAWRQAFLHFGEPYREDFLFEVRGMPEEPIVRLYNERYGRSLDPAAMSVFKHEYFEREARRIKPIPLVAAVVYRYAGKLPMAIVSGGRKDHVAMSLAVTGLASYFPVVLTAGDGLPPKPAPDLFLEAARRLQVPPGKCLVFEDGGMGLEGARLAGMAAVDVRPLI